MSPWRTASKTCPIESSLVLVKRYALQMTHLFRLLVMHLWEPSIPGLVACACSSEENGVSPCIRRGPSPEATAAAVAAPPETPSKAACVLEESAVATPPRSASKNKQQLNIRTELEQRQGGKPLLNLVIIGTNLSA